MSKRSLAVAYTMKRKGKKLQAKEESTGLGKVLKTGGDAKRPMGTSFKSNEEADYDDEKGMRKLNIKSGEYEMHGPKGELKAHGGSVDGCPDCKPCMSHGNYAKGGKVVTQKEYSDESSAKRARRDEKKSGKVQKVMFNEGSDYKGLSKEKYGPGYAEGGEVSCPNCEHKFSHGGQVANDTDMSADQSPNEFDDLVLRDDLEQSYTGKNSGDEIGSDDEIVRRAMAKRKAKKND